MSGATLTALLQQWPDQRLERLLHLRPDLLLPPVPDFAALAARSVTQVSVARALDGLHRSHLDLLEALAVLPDDGGGPGTGRLADFLARVCTAAGSPTGASAGARAEPPEVQSSAEADVTALLEDLADRLLVLAQPLSAHRPSTVSSPEPARPTAQHATRWQLPESVRAALGARPLGLGRPAEVLTADAGHLPADRAGLDVLLARHPLVTGAERLRSALTAVLEALQDHPVAILPDPPSDVHRVLLETGLLIELPTGPHGERWAEIPREAGLAWRDQHAGRGISTAAPAPTGRTVSGALRRNAALAAITDLLRSVDDLIRSLSARGGLPTLRSGGVGVRELKALAGSLGQDPEQTSWLLELAVAAGLVVLDPDTSHWTDAEAARDWRRTPRSQQWRLLVEGWLACGRAPVRGPAVPAGVPARALAADRTRPDAPRLRVAVLQTAAEVSAERPGVELTAAVAHRQRWARPRPHARTSAFTAPLLDEAEQLGLSGAGALTEPGALVAAGRVAEAADVVGNALPAPVTRVRLQSDLTAVAPGYLHPDLARRLDTMADHEGEGSARIYRFSDASVHRALEAGSTAENLLEMLAEHSEDQVPPALAYLVRDVARRHGALQYGPGKSWLRAEDETLLDAVAADPAMAPARLERLAPTVLMAGVGEQELIRLMRAAGHRASRVTGSTADPAIDPAANDDAGTDPAPAAVEAEPRLTPPATSAAQPFPEPVQSTRWAPDDAQVKNQVARLRAAPGATPADTAPQEVVGMLRRAARRRDTLEVMTVDRSGQRHRMHARPLAVAGGRVRLHVTDRQTETVVPLHRVVWARTSQ